MNRQQQIVDTDSGEILSSRKINTNVNFVQFYRKEMNSIRELIKTEPKAANLFMFLAEQMDQHNALVVSQETLAEYFEISKRTIIRQLAVLKEKGFIDNVRTGSSNVYLINANIVWASHANNREYAQFKSVVLISRTEQKIYDVKNKRLKQLEMAV